MFSVIGGGGWIFFERISGGGGSAARLTPLVTTTTMQIFFRFIKISFLHVTSLKVSFQIENMV
jgi:hypothetical protein